MSFPINPYSPVPETVVILYSVHPVYNVMGNHALQLADKASEDLHLGNGHEFGFLKRADMARDCREVLIDAGKGTVRLQLPSEMFSLKMLCSQVCLHER